MAFLIASSLHGLLQATRIRSQTKSKKRKGVTSIGDIFFKCKNPAAIREWYGNHLGLNTDEYGTSFEWQHADDSSQRRFTQWTPFSQSANILTLRKRIL